MNSLLDSLPKPPVGKHGWPWTEAPESLPVTMPDGSPWPLISVITPSYNQSDYIEETIRSIILQGYPNLEYIVIDGESNDDTISILQKYSPWISKIVIEKDSGQASAINKGFLLSHGDILTWINSDDILHYNALQSAAITFNKKNHIPFVGYGRRVYLNRNSEIIRQRPAFIGQTNLYLIVMGLSLGFYQESSFWNRKAWEVAGPLREDYFAGLDLDFFCRMLLKGVKPVYCPNYIGGWRKWGGTKCEKRPDIINSEAEEIRNNYRLSLNFPGFLNNSFLLEIVKRLFMVNILFIKDTRGMPPIGDVIHIKLKGR